MSADDTMPALPPPPPGFDPEAEFDNVTPELFTAVPKSSHRREGGDRELRSIVSIGLLTLYLSNKKGWHPPSPEKLAAKYAEGVKVIRDAVKELERAGFVVKYRTQGKGGLWKTHVRVSADPAALVAVGKWAAELTAAQAAQAAAKKAAGLSGGGRRAVAARAAAEQEPPADDDQNAEPVTSAAYTFPQVGPDAMDRHSVQGELKDQEKVLGDQEENPPRSNGDGHAARDAGAVAGGSEASPTNTPEPSALDRLVAELAETGHWPADAVREVLVELANRGRDRAEIAQVFREVAAGEHGATGSPRRLLTWWPSPRTAVAEASTEPYRHKSAPACLSGCDCWKHQAPAGAAPERSDEAAAAIAAVRAGLPAGKPLWRRGGLHGTPPRVGAGTAGSGDVGADSGAAVAAA